MIIAKNLCALRKAHTLGGRSPSSQVMVQSSSMPPSSSTGPSRKACPSPESLAGGVASSFDQSGLPENRSASHQTPPASIASRSVAESAGSTLRAQRKGGRGSQSRRKDVSLMETPLRSWRHHWWKQHPLSR